MWGKIAGIGLVALLTVALVGGSAYILLRSDEDPILHAAHGPDHSGGNHGHTGNVSGGHREWEHSHGSGANDEGEHHPIETWTTVTGTVVALDHDLVLQTEEGEVVVCLGPEWRWESTGLTIAPGDQVTVTGFYTDDKFEAASIENLTTGQAVTLRDEVGRPLRAGRWRGGR